MNTKRLKLPHVNCKYGAPMGRPNTIPHDLDNPLQHPARLYLRRMVMVDGDYDEGGAYWGGPSQKTGCMWYAYTGKEDHKFVIFVRAFQRIGAKMKVLSVLPNATFRS